jgi:hypothetical protein
MTAELPGFAYVSLSRRIDQGFLLGEKNMKQKFSTFTQIMIISIYISSVITLIPVITAFSQSNTRYKDSDQESGTVEFLFLPIITHGNPGSSSSIVSNLQVITPSVARYEKFEVHFDVDLDIINPYLPYTISPPPGIQPGLGISIDALFSNDNWETTITQPAFFYQPYSHSVIDGLDHLIPNGSPRWAVRFAPIVSEEWEFRIRVQNDNGTSIYPELNTNPLSFHVSETSDNPYIQTGLLRVSPNDSRYFEFLDGSPFIGIGFNDGFNNTAEVQQKMQSYEQNKMNFMRVWMSGAGINGSQWSSWASHHLPHDGYLPGVGFDIENTFSGADVALRLDNQNPCYFTDFWQGGVPVEPNTTYQVTARVKINEITGPLTQGEYGFTIKQAGWLGMGCNQPDNGTLITAPIYGSTDWIVVTGTYTTGSDQYWLDNLYLTLQNATAGQVFIDEVRVWQIDDQYQVNILREPNANSHLYFDPMNSAKWDKFIEEAEKHGVYLKLVIDEKNEWIRNHIDSNGNITDVGDNDNFYASSNTKVRWLQEAWWRYLIARWGYSTAIHSFEYINEGDPYNGNHYKIANALANYIHENDPNRHMVTTSFWHSFPNIEFWSNPKYSDIDYADIHAYISTGWGNRAIFLEESNFETNIDHVRSEPISARINGYDEFTDEITPRGLVIKGAGEWIVRYWMKAENFSTNCSFGSTGGMQRVRWSVDGGPYWGGEMGVVPNNSENKDYVCTSPVGTYEWTEFRSDLDRDGNLLPLDVRLILDDDLPHELTVQIENSDGTGGTAWIDDVELVNPSGAIVSLLGYFDITPMDDDTAWYNHAYGELYGGKSSVGARMPLVRGETGIDSPNEQDWNRDLLLDTEGIWLHNNVWGHINHTGMTDLFWWVSETIPEHFYEHFLTYRNFMDGILITSGNYQNIQVQTSHPNLRAWGQIDEINGSGHLWIQNTNHTWKRIVYGPPIPSISGSITLLNLSDGQYQVEWWDTYETSNPILLTQILSSSGGLTLTLPNGLMDDIAVKIFKIQ